AAVGEVLADDLADAHAGDPYVGLIGQRRRLGERDLDPVALGLERDRAAERQPQEHQQPEARDREHDHREQPGDGWGLLGHYFAQASDDVRIGVSIARNSSSGCSWTICSIVEHEAPSVTGRNTPLASELENSWLAMWSTQASQNR